MKLKLVKKRRKASGKRPPPISRKAEPTHAEMIAKMHIEIGRRLALAFVSYQMVTTYETARKNYGHEEPGPYWISLSKRLCADYSSGRFRAFQEGE